MKTEQEQRRAIRQILFDANDICQATPCENEYCIYYGDYRCYDNVIVDKLIRAGYGDVSEYKAEIERLKAENEKLLDSIESVQAGRCRLRCPLTKQAVKEFAERLSVKALCLAQIETYHICNLIDELIKEVENDK